MTAYVKRIENLSEKKHICDVEKKRKTNCFQIIVIFKIQTKNVYLFTVLYKFVLFTNLLEFNAHTNTRIDKTLLVTDVDKHPSSEDVVGLRSLNRKRWLESMSSDSDEELAKNIIKRKKRGI